MKKSLDHFLHTVDNLETASNTYKKLGFNVRPIAKHIELGSQNCVIQFQDTYYELAYLDNGKDSLVSPYRQRLDFGEGLTHVSLTSESLEEDRAHLEKAGLSPDKIKSARRKITMPDGILEETDSSFVYVWREDNAYLSLFVSQHYKPETIFIPKFQQHENGVIDVAKIVFATTTLAADKAYFSTHFGKAPDSETLNGFTMKGAHGDVSEVLQVSEFNKRYGQIAKAELGTLAGLPKLVVYHVENVEETKKHFDTHAIQTYKMEEGIGIHEKEAHGCAMIFI